MEGASALEEDTRMTCPPDLRSTPCSNVKDSNGEPSDMPAHERLSDIHTNCKSRAFQSRSHFGSHSSQHDALEGLAPTQPRFT